MKTSKQLSELKIPTLSLLALWRIANGRAAFHSSTIIGTSENTNVAAALTAIFLRMQMAGEFLVLMVFLDKFWFSPVGKVLDERDATIRNQLSSVKGNSGDVDKLVAEAADIIKAARSETTSMINSKKTEKQAELDKVCVEEYKLTSHLQISYLTSSIVQFNRSTTMLS